MAKSKTRSKIHEVPAILSVLADPLLNPCFDSFSEHYFFRSCHLKTSLKVFVQVDDDVLIVVTDRTPNSSERLRNYFLFSPEV